MKTYDVTLSRGEVQLRLTTGKLQQYLNKTGGLNMHPLLGVLDAVNNLEKKVELLRAALTWPGNPNKEMTLDGAELLDMLVDEGLSGEDINGVILQLAQDAGLVAEDQREQLADALAAGSNALFGTICDALAGNEPDREEPAPKTENPTQATASGG